MSNLIAPSLGRCWNVVGRHASTTVCLWIHLRMRWGGIGKSLEPRGRASGRHRDVLGRHMNPGPRKRFFSLSSPNGVSMTSRRIPRSAQSHTVVYKCLPTTFQRRPSDAAKSIGGIGPSRGRLGRHGDWGALVIVGTPLGSRWASWPAPLKSSRLKICIWFMIISMLYRYIYIYISCVVVCI